MDHTLTHHPAAHPPAPPAPRRWLALALLCAAQFMLVLDVTVVQVALPTIGAELTLGRAALTWVVTGYTVSFGGLMLLGGRLADLLGARRMLLAGLVMFTLASLAGALAGNGGTLIAARVAQGVGAALLSPAALSIVTTTFTGPERHRALGVWAGLGGLGAALGVIAGGLLTAGPGWAWVFLVNVPVGIVVVGLVPLAVRPDGHRTARRRLDVAGAALITAAVAALIYGLITAGDTGWTDPDALLPLGAAVVLLVAFAAVERAVRSPLMRVQLLARRPVLSGAVLMLVATGLLIAFFFLGSLYLQHTRGFGALATGLMFLPAAAATGAGAHLGGRLIGRIGGRPVAAGGLLLAAAGALWMARIAVDGGELSVLVPGMAIAAFGLGPVFVAATASALAHVDHQEAGLASGVVNTFHELGGAVGVALASTAAATSVSAAVPQIAGFTTAYATAALVAAVTAVVAVVLVPAGKPVLTGGPHVH
ncbi:MFS transporter [Longispora sp. K20-0274]|uniref:MFS transporter n=1 Tax=Longispora sp. K20-0274 TaxID=3088255 RepID=UPI00399B05C2